MQRFLVTAVVALFVGAALAGCTSGPTDAPPTGGTATTTTTTMGGDEETAAQKAALATCADEHAEMEAPASFTPSEGKTPKGPVALGGKGSGAALKDTYTILTIGEPESLDPAYDYESAGGQIIANVYETLYTYDGASAIDLVPGLAAEMPAYSEDRKVMQIKLRDGVKFHDGSDLTAADVKFSLDRIILHNDPHSPAFIYYSIACADEYGHIDPSAVTAEDRANYLRAGGVKAIGDDTVQITLAFPDPAWLYKLAFQAASIVSMDAFCENKPEGAGDDCLAPPGETRHAWADDHAVGTGPFKFELWTKGQEVILTRNDDYWGEKPELARVIVKKVDDFNTRLTALKTGVADEIYVPVDHDKDVMGLENVEVIERPSWSVSFIGFNQAFCGGRNSANFDSCMADNADSVPKGADGAADPDFFADINMRKAWSHAFDYETYLNDILKGHGQLLNGVLPEGIFGWSGDVTSPTQDLTKAREFLGMTKHKDGFKVTIFYNQGNTVREKTAQLLAQNLMELGDGIDVEVQGLDWSTAFLPKQRAEALPVFYLGWLPDYAYPDNYVHPFAHSKGHFAPRVNYVNTDLDAKIDALLRETDDAKLASGWKEVTQMLNDDYVYIFLGQASNFHVQRDYVQGYYYNPMHSGAPNSGDFAALSKA